MSLKLKLSALAAAAALSFASVSAYATNGAAMPGYGVQSMSMGGVGIASGQDALSAAANPANLSWVGMRGDIDFTYFNPNAASKVYAFPSLDPGQPNNKYVNSSSDAYYIPNMGIAMPLTDRLSVGLAFIAASGMGSSFNPNFFSSTVPQGAPSNETVGMQLMQMIIPLTVAFKPTENQSIGFSIIPALQRFKMEGISTFAYPYDISSDPHHLTNQGAQLSYGWGARIGWIGHFVDGKVALGATYATKEYMSKIKGYKGLFAGGGSFDMPAQFGVGLALHPNDQWTVAFDINRIMWNQIPAMANTGPATFANITFNCTTSANPVSPSGVDTCLGTPNGMGFGWQNQTVYKLGLAYKVTHGLTLKAGYNYAHSPIPNSQLSFNTLAPATVERHYSIGFSYKLADSPLEISGFFMRVPPHEQCQSNLPVTGGACIKMNQNWVGVGLGWVLGSGN